MAMSTPTITNESFEGGNMALGSSSSALSRKSLGATVYMECQKNHAAGIGGMATDGCCEFIASAEKGTLEALICCACKCHRNFHRKVPIQVQAGDEVESYRRKDKKRSRTKFSAEQKEKMLEFALKSDWKMQKMEESEVKCFCEEIGIKKNVLKVWMHNNKYKYAKKSTPTPSIDN